MKNALTILFVFTLVAIILVPVTVFAEQGERLSQNMIERHDGDGDGKVSMDEFPGPNEHFTRIDQDGDGYINESEARKNPRPRGRRGSDGRDGMNKFGTGDGIRNRGGHEPRKFYEDDSDGDSKVSRTEFSGPSDHFDRLDLNGDGYIQENEARQGIPGGRHGEMTRENDDMPGNDL